MWSSSTNASRMQHGNEEQGTQLRLVPVPFFRCIRSVSSTLRRPAIRLPSPHASRFARAAEFGQCRFYLGVQLIEPGDQFS